MKIPFRYLQNTEQNSKSNSMERYQGGGSFRRRRFGAADSALDNSAPCRNGTRHFGAVS